MPILHDPATRESIRSRVQRLTPNARRLWGKMSVDQMLWHVNTALEQPLGRIRFSKPIPFVPKRIVKWVLLNTKWPKGAPTQPEILVSGERYSFEEQHRRCLALIDELTARPLDGWWPDSDTLGKMSGRDWSKLEAIHLDHHLRQFSL
jgi:DinB family protein